MAEENKPLDIWGEPIGEKHECFYCGGSYYPNNSDAPEDYRTTYCSLHCYERDVLEMKMTAEAQARFDGENNTNEDTESSGANSGSYTTTKIGDFILKVRKNQGEEK